MFKLWNIYHCEVYILTHGKREKYMRKISITITLLLSLFYSQFAAATEKIEFYCDFPSRFQTNTGFPADQIQKPLRLVFYTDNNIYPTKLQFMGYWDWALEYRSHTVNDFFFGADTTGIVNWAIIKTLMYNKPKNFIEIIAADTWGQFFSECRTNRSDWLLE